ncbi:hypothetical protein Aperf_G00000100055 [Anoplocephala perfoliata]
MKSDVVRILNIYGRKYPKKHEKRSNPPRAFYVNLEKEKNAHKYFRESRRDSSSSENLEDGERSKLTSLPLGHDGLKDILFPNQQKMRQTQKTAPSQELPSGSLLYGRKSNDYDPYVDDLLFPKQGKEHATYDQGSLYGPLSSKSKGNDIQRKMGPALNHKEKKFSGTHADKNVRSASAQRTRSQMSRMSVEIPQFDWFPKHCKQHWPKCAFSAFPLASHNCRSSCCRSSTYTDCTAHRMPIFRPKLMQSLPVHKTASNSCDDHKDSDILKSIRIRGIGFSGPCQTPDFVPASIYLKSRKSSQDTASVDDTTTVAESIVDFSPSPALMSATSSPIRKPIDGSQVTDVDVNLRRDERGFGLRLIGGAEEGTQVRVGALTPGGQAELSGKICSGDTLIAINGVSVVGSTHSSVVQLLSAAAPTSNTTVTLTLRGQRPTRDQSPPDESSMEQSFRRSFSEESSIHSKLSMSSSSEPNSPVRRSLSFYSNKDAKSTSFKVKLYRRPKESFGFSVNRSLSPDGGCHIGR